MIREHRTRVFTHGVIPGFEPHWGSAKSALQDTAARTAIRFVLNSTFGMSGLLDVAGREGILQESVPYRDGS